MSSSRPAYFSQAPEILAPATPGRASCLRSLGTPGTSSGVLIYYGDNVPDNAPIGPIDDLELLMIEGGLVIEKALLEKRLQSLEGRRSGLNTG